MKYAIIGLILCLFLIGIVVGEEIDVEKNQSVEANETETLEALMMNKDWSRIAELINKDNTQFVAHSESLESSIKPATSDERWDNWFAPKEEEGFIIIPCGG